MKNVLNHGQHRGAEGGSECFPTLDTDATPDKLQRLERLVGLEAVAD